VANFPQVNRELESDPSKFKGDLRPVERVSWHEAVEFCDRLAQHTNRPYRLPTEAEWEYACRADTTTPFHFGATLSTDYANYRGTGEYGAYGSGNLGEYRKETTPVNFFDCANAWGLCDMHGNVWEWCEDDWHSNYRDAPSDGRAWLSEKNSGKIIRGGSWDFNPRNCRSAYRSDDISGLRFNYIGFRVCCSPPRT
jgi:formylglycine-generating enzyme required for sulfatase activity